MLARDIFGDLPHLPVDLTPLWQQVALFDGVECIATAEVAVLPILYAGSCGRFGAIRRVCIRPSRRGAGLLRPLMLGALAWCQEQGVQATFLYTEHPPLYTPFGFQPVAQHSFIGVAPRFTYQPKPDLHPVGDRLLHAAANQPLSQQVAIVEAPRLAAERVAGGLDGFEVSYSARLDAVLVYANAGADLVIADVIGPTVPTMAQIVAELAPNASTVRVLFPPDQLDWVGTPESDDTGLMALGLLPLAMERPFMFPPTQEF